MSQVSVIINGRAYEVACADGEEAEVERAGRDVSRRVDELARTVGPLGDTRLLLLAGLHFAHELAAVSAEAERLSERDREAALLGSAELAAAIDRLAGRIEAVAATLESA
ncbi:MAG: cell division protein ZapA [Rhodospirillaceae bacterium]|nr:cell division protein ZapA [Rhodospirillaceae bacterium]